MQKVLIGAGGHGAVVASAALLVFGGFDRIVDASPVNSELLGVTVERTGSLFAEQDPQSFFVAIGNNARREQLIAEGLAAGWHLLSVHHPSALVDDFAHIEPGCYLGPQSVVHTRAVIKQGAVINTGAIVEHDCVVGESAFVAPGAVMCGGASLGTRSMLGATAVVVPNCAIAGDVTIGAGAVACDSIETPGTYIGVPARLVAPCT